MEFKEYLAGKLDEAMRAAFGQSIEGLAGFLETPPNPEMGDFAFPCFKLSKTQIGRASCRESVCAYV